VPRPTKTKDLTRVAFRTPDGEVVTSLWCRVAERDDGVKVTLLNDYGDDFKPEAGWVMDIGGRLVEVTKVEGREAEGGAR